MILKKLVFHCFSLLSAGLCLQACVVVQPKILNGMTDNSIITGSIMPDGTMSERVDLNGDEHVISSIIAQQFDSGDSNWKNDSTGSRGTLSVLNSFVENGTPCRTFKTTRESFDGVKLYEGKACKQNDVAWNIFNLNAL